MQVEMENGNVKHIDWQAEIDRVYDRKWEDNSAYEHSARCGALRAVIEQIGRKFNALAELHDKPLIPEDDDTVFYRGCTIRHHYPMPSGWIWYDPNNPDGDYGDGMLEECIQAIDEYLEEQDG